MPQHEARLHIQLLRQPLRFICHMGDRESAGLQRGEGSHQRREEEPQLPMTPDPRSLTATILPQLSACVEMGLAESDLGHHLVRVPVLNWERARAVLVRWVEEMDEANETNL
jgi:hypothetical protein